MGFKLENNEEYSDYAYNTIETICNEIGTRYPGTEGEKLASQWIKNEWSTFCDDIKEEEFSIRPMHYPQGLFRVLYPMGVLVFFLLPLKQPYSIIASILFLVTFVLFAIEYTFIVGPFKYLFKKGTSRNVYGTIKPTKEKKITVVLDGHIDSALELPWARSKRIWHLLIIGIFTVLYILSVIIYPIIKISIFTSVLVVDYSWFIFEITNLDIIMLPIISVCFIFFSTMFAGLITNRRVMGANDNLSSIAMAGAIGKYFSKNRLEHVELVILSTGAEEIGEQGAKFFAKNHPEILENSYTLVYECVGAGDRIFVIEKDDMHAVSYSPEVIDRLTKAYEKYAKENEKAIGYSTGKLFIGSSNANMYIKEGYKSTFFIAQGEIPWRPVHWHSRDDTMECIEKDFLKEIFKLSLVFIKSIDEEYD